jgi:hypothetical protein
MCAPFVAAARRGAAEDPADFDEPFGMGAVRLGVQVDGVVGEPAGQVPGGLGRLGAVLGDVPETWVSLIAPVTVTSIGRMSA